MKTDKDLARRLRIPTKYMRPYDLIRGQDRLLSTGLFDELISTRAYRENGVLHCDHRGPLTYAHFIQRNDGQFFVSVLLNKDVQFELIRQYLDPDIDAEVILCKVPVEHVNQYEKGYLNSEYGPIEFLAQHHPSAHIRIELIEMLHRYATMEMQRCG